MYRLGGEAPGLKDVVLELATRARDHLSTSKSYIDELREKDKEILELAFPAFLTGVSILHKHISSFGLLQCLLFDFTMSSVVFPSTCTMHVLTTFLLLHFLLLV